MECFEMLVILKEHLGLNKSQWDAILNGDHCRENHTKTENKSSMFLTRHQYNLQMGNLGKNIYAYVTPFIFAIGVLGNLLSMKVFRSKFMRRFSSSYYLVCLSVSDLMVLVFYVFLDWLNRGLPRWPYGQKIELINKHGMCQVFLYFSYAFRFTSVYLVVLLTAERYVILCWPKQRKQIATKRCACKCIVIMSLLASVISIYKPSLSGVFPTHTETGPSTACMRSPSYTRVNFVLDSIYAMLITAVPFMIIIVFSMPILRKLGSLRPDQKPNRIRKELTFIPLALSCTFMCLNVPYFVVWCFHFRETLNPTSLTQTDKLSGVLYITRTIFYLNYCCNFFLYCFFGAFYRREICSLFHYYRKRKATVHKNQLASNNRKCNASCKFQRGTMQTRCGSAL